MCTDWGTAEHTEDGDASANPDIRVSSALFL